VADVGSIDAPRELTPDERALLEFMIALAPSSQVELRIQASTARVSGVCKCGCGTYDLHVDPTTPPATGLDTPAADVVGRGDDHPLEVLLFVGDGRLGCVEIVRYGDVPPGKPLPRPEELGPQSARSTT
jgi:hypothetical protein